MPLVRMSGGGNVKKFVTMTTKSGFTQSINDDGSISGSGYDNCGTDGGYPQNVPITVISFSSSKPFNFVGVLAPSGMNAYIDLELYVDNELIGNTAKDVSTAQKTISLSNCPSGVVEIKINNWRGASSGGSTINFSAV